MSYQALARKWRPAQFEDIVGQGPVVRTLMNAIRSERIHPAYLLTGSRGIGKTSIARILAKAIRCPNRTDTGATPNPWMRSCGTCASCMEIASGNSVDVIEIDGASNNGVDAVREIRENAKYLPSFGERKIYIIDEVHMLTTAAFNALLKTIEEPPPHVLFIFATTEPHKIPGTILSRCQRFDLHRVTLPQIQDRLSQVLKAEQIPFEQAALVLLSRSADGSMRDALSLLDQVIAFSAGNLTAQAVRESVGLIESQTLIGITKGLLERTPQSALKLAEDCYRKGHDLKVLSRSLIEILHALLLIKVGAIEGSTLELSTEELAELRELAPLRPIEDIEIMFQILHQCVEWLARSPQPKIVLDVFLIKCASAEEWVQAGAQSSGGQVSQFGGSVNSSGQRGAQNTQVTRPGPIPPMVPRVESQAQNLAPTVASAPAQVPTQGPKTFESWVEWVRGVRPLLASILEHGAAEITDDQLLILFRPEDSYYKDQLHSKAYVDSIPPLAKEYFQKSLRIKVEQRNLKDSSETLAAKRTRIDDEKNELIKQKVLNHPIINEARSLFGGDLGPIELTGEKTQDESKKGSKG